ncbi:MAG: enoyl-CoA hydratase/isomerase family protein [Candidatus Bathyarchaeota archaeon]|nr:MAG: enoyl-CoA hydratase/isomerase family protein [Candidatus Bathyarchaeota archaeon]
MEVENAIYEKSDGMATITINRPKALNALNKQAVQEILSRLNDAEADETVKVIVITGTGDKAFCVGLDLKAVKGISAVNGMNLSLLGQELTKKIESLRKPVIAAINGYALGGGLELAMSCDLRIASENAKVGQPELNVGLIPGWGGTQRLPRLVGRGIAKELIFTGKMIDAETAKQLGVLNKVVPPDQLKSVVKELAAELMTKPPIGIQLAKQLINSSIETDLTKGLVQEAQAFGVLASTEDFDEGVAAFIEKRKPQYKGK